MPKSKQIKFEKVLKVDYLADKDKPWLDIIDKTGKRVSFDGLEAIMVLRFALDEVIKRTNQEITVEQHFPLQWREEDGVLIIEHRDPDY